MSNTNYYYLYFLIALVFIFFCSLVFTLSIIQNTTNSIVYLYPVVKATKPNTSVKIILGEGFKNPGEYEVTSDLTYFDIISRYENAYNPQIHALDLSKTVKDKDFIYIPPVSPTLQSKNISDKTQQKMGSINSATTQEIATVKGVGEVTAKKIFEYINDTGGIDSIDELDAIPGVGEKTINEIKKHFY